MIKASVDRRCVSGSSAMADNALSADVLLADSVSLAAEASRASTPLLAPEQIRQTSWAKHREALQAVF